MDQDAISKMIADAIKEAMLTAKPEGWEAQMMVAAVGIGILFVVAAMISFYRLANKYMESSDAREVLLTARVGKLEMDLTTSAARREVDVISALNASAESNQRAASMIADVGEIIKNAANEKSIAITVLEWMDNRVCAALDPASMSVFKALVLEKQKSLA